MTATVVTLNKVRKARAKVAKTATAAANRAKFGRTKAEREAQAVADRRRDTVLDGALRQD